jgi:outer membrane murein-binding lipoprotein Lpp
MTEWQLVFMALVIVAAIPVSIWRSAAASRKQTSEVERLSAAIARMHDDVDALRSAAERVAKQMEWGEIRSPRAPR